MALLGKEGPDSVLVSLNGIETSMYELILQSGSMPLVITMGSYSWPPFVRNRTAIVDMFRKYGTGEKKVANFLTVYVEEAHARDDWRVPSGANPGGEDIDMHRSLEDRLTAARKFVKDFEYPVEMVVDSMKDQALLRYEASPERLFVIERGVVVYRGGQGPFFYKPEEVLAWLHTRFGVRE